MVKDGSGSIFLHQHLLVEYFRIIGLLEEHTLTTLLGLEKRYLENWLLNKKEVTKLTIIEKNLGIIEYHRNMKKVQIFEKAEVIHADANEYVGHLSCAFDGPLRARTN